MFLGTILSTSGCLCPNHAKLDKLNINEVLHKLPHYFKANATQASIDRKQAVDMSKVPDAVLNETMRRIQSMHEASTGYNVSLIEDVSQQVLHETRTKILKDTRRHGLPWHGYKDLSWDWASEFIARQKMLDLMVTLIYMARHQLTAMNTQLSTRRDSSYRMAYLYSKLDLLRKKIKLIYNKMKSKASDTKWGLKKTRKYLVLLHKNALKIHSQFNFYYFMIARIHRNLLDESVNTTVPVDTKETRNLSFEEKPDEYTLD